jgi:hypothetical protein
MKRLLFVAVLGALLTAAAMGDGILNTNDTPVQIVLSAETGFVDVISHRIQIGQSGTEFDYVGYGGQEILFPFSRFTTELELEGRHTVIFLLQPLEIATQVRFDEAVTVDDVVFPAGGGVNVTYGFPFYRVSYLYDFLESERTDVEAGVSLQLRNASIRFESTDGENVAVSQDLGPVPIIKLRLRHVFDTALPGFFAELEADGFFASSAFINGASYEFSGSIFDASIRSGFQPTPGVELFANVRGLGGGARGTRPIAEREFWSQSQSGFTDNFLTSMSLTFGARLR